MDTDLLRLLPIFAGFGAAYAAKSFGLLRAQHGVWLLRLSLYVTLPALLLVSVSQVDFTVHLLIFPLLSALVMAVTLWVMQPLRKRLQLARPSEGTFRIAPLVISSAFVLPFLLALHGSEGVTRVVLFNAGFSPLLLLVVYGIAATYNPAVKSRVSIIEHVLFLPPLWALAAAATLNATNTQLPAMLETVLRPIGNCTVLITIMALGILFHPQHIRFNKTLGVLGLRMGIGLLVGLAVVTLLGLTGVDRAAVLALAAAPIGFNLLTFASIEHLDEKLAADAISLSMAVGLVVTPLIILLAS